MRPAFVIIIAYLLGSIPFGYLIVRLREGSDVRKTGSGGMGATNVSRRAGKTAGAVTLLLDAMKGAAAVIIAKVLLGLPIFTEGGQSPPSLQTAYWWVAAVAVAVIVGHIFPVWLGFRGGKGVATGLGVFLMLAPISVALAVLLFVFVVALTRYVSLGSILATATIPLFVLLQDRFIRPVADLMSLVTAASAGAILIIFAHRENIARLIQGTESKFK